MDRLDQWWQASRERHPQVRRLLLDLDNGPENHSRRSQFLLRMIQFAWKYRVTLMPCYYPPYHSECDPIERCWGILENYWRGELLGSEAAVLGDARPSRAGRWCAARSSSASAPASRPAAPWCGC